MDFSRDHRNSFFGVFRGARVPRERLGGSKTMLFVIVLCLLDRSVTFRLQQCSSVHVLLLVHLVVRGCVGLCMAARLLDA